MQKQQPRMAGSNSKEFRGLGAKNRVKLELLLSTPGLRVIFKEVGVLFSKTDRANRYV